MQRRALLWKRRGLKVGFVPTLGYLHDGHLSLVRKARRHVGPRGIVVVSIYVNPTQFGPQEDLAKYPRNLPRDRKLCREAGVDFLFLPLDTDIYPGGAQGVFSAYVVEEQLSQRMEGTARPTHFKGVTTIVAKLFNLVQPEIAVFGEKDAQQAAVIQKMVRDLNFPVKIVLSPTVREKDGLALSSRNSYLSAEERAEAVVLWRTLQLGRSRVRRDRKPVPSGKLKADLIRFVAGHRLARLEYLEVFDPATLEPVRRVVPGARMALAVRVGKTRLIDNLIL